MATEAMPEWETRVAMTVEAAKEGRAGQKGTTAPEVEPFPLVSTVAMEAVPKWETRVAMTVEATGEGRVGQKGMRVR